MSIKVLKLINGEDLIAETEKRDNGTVRLTDVNQIVQVPTEGGGMGLMLLPYMSFANTDKGIPIKEENVIFRLDPSNDLLSEYKKIYSKIITLDHGGITT